MNTLINVLRYFDLLTGYPIVIGVSISKIMILDLMRVVILTGESGEHNTLPGLQDVGECMNSTDKNREKIERQTDRQTDRQTE